MKSNLKKASLLLTGILVGSKLFAQAPDTTRAMSDYIKPFSNDGAFRTWSIGVSGGGFNTIYYYRFKQESGF
jgi:OOP family OmpA-OmpF porin